MREKLINYIDTLFADASATKENLELKEEIMHNTLQRYDDFISEGKSEETAFNLTVAGIGDVTELLAQMRRNAPSTFTYTKEEIDRDNRRNGLMMAAAVMLYILSVIPPIIFSAFPSMELLGVCLMFVMIALATGLIIYRSKTRLRYNRSDDTVVENFKEWNHENQGKRALQKSISSGVWALIVVLYFVISFTTQAWYITWLIFPIGAAVDNIVRACMDLRK
ncbi:MAG: hypothetical protein DBX52_03255 [Clostridiales bacterium]|nr:MAG: hypothetical protein DBX52_03255 [Clostridiales bacterium]